MRLIRPQKSTTKKVPKSSKFKTAMATSEFELPTEPDDLSSDLREYSMLVHGEKKIGKTSLFSQEDGAFFIEWDPAQKALRILQRHMADWSMFLQCLKALEKRCKAGTCPYRTVVIDGIDLMYLACFGWKCKQLGIDHPNDEKDFGKSWGEIKKEFSTAIHRLLNLKGIACRFICHSAWKELRTRRGRDTERLVPNLSGQAEEVLVGLVDIWAAYVYVDAERALIIKGDETTGAGHRVDHCFRTPLGDPISEIPMGGSPADAYTNLVRAFTNKQSFTTMEERRVERPRPKKHLKLKKK